VEELLGFDDYLRQSLLYILAFFSGEGLSYKVGLVFDDISL
jgi:hypothetical protein